MSEIHFKLGRNNRSFDTRIPHFSTLIAGKSLASIPESWDWTSNGKMPKTLGMMCNDKLLDCTCASIYHARQVWTANTGTMITEPDVDVELLYQKACGWNPSLPGNDPGGNEQAVLTYTMNNGAPIGLTGSDIDKITAFFEVDHRIIEDVKRTIYSCGVAYIGFHFPNSLHPKQGPTPTVWVVDPKNSTIIGSHAVILAGYTPEYAIVISWGQYYQMTWPFFSKFVDEVYAIIDDRWFGAMDTDPLGVSVPQLVAQMQALKEPIAP